MRMSKACWPLVLSLILVTGCARHYALKLTNGSEITTASKPKLKGGSYYYKDVKGEQHVLAAGRVREIAPVSMAKRESKPKPVKSNPPKKRKWYFLWLY
jgi:hypothetical protein